MEDRDEKLTTERVPAAQMPAAEPGDSTSPEPIEDAAPAGPAVEHVADMAAASLKLVAEESWKRKQPIRLRVMLSLFNPKSGQYLAWRGQIWKFGVKGIKEAQRAQQVLETVFDLVELCGVEIACRELQMLMTRVRQQKVNNKGL